MEEDRMFEQITDPEYAEKYTAMLTELHDKGASLAEAAADEVEPMRAESPDGAKKFSVTLHQEALQEAGFSAEFLSGELLFFENHEQEETDWPKSITILLRRAHEVENIVKFDIEPEEPLTPWEDEVEHPQIEHTGKTGTVITSDFYTIHDPTCPRPEAAAEQQMWPLSHSAAYNDLEGNNVLPAFEQPQYHLSAMPYGIDLRGGEMLKKLLEAEAKIREVELP